MHHIIIAILAIAMSHNIMVIAVYIISGAYEPPAALWAAHKLLIIYIYIIHITDSGILNCMKSGGSWGWGLETKSIRIEWPKVLMECMKVTTSCTT